TLRWLDADRASQTLGLLQFSRRVADIGITGQVNYRIKPQGEMTDVLLNADKPLRQGYRASLAVERLHEERDLRYTLGLTKVLGRFGLRLNASHSRNGESALGLQLFIAATRDPRDGSWRTDAQPVTHTGAASMQVFLDRNQNGVRDEDEPAIPD